MTKTPLWLAAMLAALLTLSGCAALRSVDSDVSTYSQWPADRKPATYAFERLPSQQARVEQQQLLENAARRTIEGAGFTPAADDTSADVSVELAARVDASVPSSYYAPIWWQGGFNRSRFGGSGFGGGFGGRWSVPTSYTREVALLIRDRKTGTTLYEAHASNDSSASAFAGLLPAMFEAALKDFPHAGINPRRVTVELPPS